VKKGLWFVASYAIALAMGALLWLILRATGESDGRAAVISAILVMGIFSFGLAGMWVWLTIFRSSPEDRPYGAFLAFVRILQGSAFFLLLWNKLGRRWALLRGSRCRSGRPADRETSLARARGV
jgi:hypothetical protein